MAATCWYLCVAGSCAVRQWLTSSKAKPQKKSEHTFTSRMTSRLRRRRKSGGRINGHLSKCSNSLCFCRSPVLHSLPALLCQHPIPLKCIVFHCSECYSLTCACCLNLAQVACCCSSLGLSAAISLLPNDHIIKQMPTRVCKADEPSLVC